MNWSVGDAPPGVGRMRALGALPSSLWRVDLPLPQAAPALPLLQPPLAAAAIAGTLPHGYGDVGLGPLAGHGGSLCAAGGLSLHAAAQPLHAAAQPLHAAAQPQPMDQTAASALSQIRALQSMLSPLGPQTGAAAPGWVLGGTGAVVSAPGCLGAASVGLGGSVPILTPPLRMCGMLPGGTDAGAVLGSPFDPAVLTFKDRAAHSALALSSDDTASRGGSEPCASSDSSDSGDKKCRSWKIMLTAEQAVEIYKQMPPDSLHVTSKSVIMGKQFGVSAKTIRDIWKRETWVKATRHVWSDADEESYRREENKNAAAACSRDAPPPGSVASLLSHADERSPSPSGASSSGGAGFARTRGRPKGVKDSRPRKRRCLSLVPGGGGGDASSSASMSPHGLYSNSTPQPTVSASHSAARSPSPS